MNVIINNKLHDEAFVNNWTTGFEELKEYVQYYTPEKVSEITWVPEERYKRQQLCLPQINQGRFEQVPEQRYIIKTVCRTRELFY
jgi:predicted molibdopterin-dependent oxidoreductase YjgC